MKRIIMLLLSLGLLVFGLTACAPAAVEEEEGEKVFRVLLMTNLAGDKSFADSAIAGGQRAMKDFGIQVDFAQSADLSEYESIVLNGIEGGYDLVMSGNSQFKDYILKHAPNYPDIMFGMTDTNGEGNNVMSVTYAQNQGSFLAGAAAAMFTVMTEFEGVNPEAKIGWVGGNEIPALKDFFLGYTEGAKYINPDIEILQSYAGSFQDPLKGKELTLAMYEQGVDIVMNVASNTGNGVLEAAKDAGLYAIGVDMNQDANQPGSILTSMLKENGEGVYQIIKRAVETEDPQQFGGRLYMDLSYGGVNLTDMSTMKQYSTPEQIAKLDEILAKIEELKAKIASGEIVVSNFEGYGKNAN